MQRKKTIGKTNLRPNRNLSSNNNPTSGTPHITVAVRVRPLSEKELVDPRNKPVVEVMDEHMICFDPSGAVMSQGKRNVIFGISGARPSRGVFNKGIPSNFHRARDQKYAFDHVFDDKTNQNEVYEKTARPLIEPVLNGYNATVFAYGATGSGKTHTMIGSEEKGPGVMILTMRDLFQRVDECRTEKTIKIAISYLEVYNETIRDLLVDNSPDLMLLDSGSEITVKGLSVRYPESAENVFEMLREGNERRSQSPTEANSNSSRSHAVLQIMVEQTDRTKNISAKIQNGKLSLIDLAGSERAAVTQNRGDRMREGANINKSLLALGNCINSLGENFKKGKHIPYRNSKLTRLLKDSLGGNCRTVMIANVSPSNISYDDSLNTLKYANRAKNIKLTVQRNVVNVNYHVKEYTKIISDLRQQVKELEERNKILEEECNIQSKAPSSLALKYSMDLEDKKTELCRAKSQVAELAQIIIDQYHLLNEHSLATSTVISGYSRAREITSSSPLKKTQIWAPVHMPSPTKVIAPTETETNQQQQHHTPQPSTPQEYHTESQRIHPNGETCMNGQTSAAASFEEETRGLTAELDQEASQDQTQLFLIQKKESPRRKTPPRRHSGPKQTPSPIRYGYRVKQPETPSSVEKAFDSTSSKDFEESTSSNPFSALPLQSPARATVFGGEMHKTPSRSPLTQKTKSRTPPSSSKRPRSILKRTSAPYSKPTEKRTVMFAGISPLPSKRRSPKRKSPPKKGGLHASSPLTSTGKTTPTHSPQEARQPPDSIKQQQQQRPRLSKPAQRGNLSRLMEPTFSSNQRLSRTSFLAPLDKENNNTPARLSVTPLLKKSSKPVRPTKL